MIVVLRADCSESQVADVTGRLEELGYLVTPVHGVEKTILGAVGGEEHAKIDAVDQLKALDWVEDVILITRSFKLVAREYRPEGTIVDLGDGVKIGGQAVVMMAGPCTVESEEQLMVTAEAVAKAGASVLRGGAYKPCTSPYSYQGMGIQGLELLREAGKRFGLKVVTEVMDPRKVELVSEYADLLQIGTRNMQNYDLLREVGRSNKAVLLKRGMSAKYEEWLLAAEYVAAAGNERIVLCERGIRTFETSTRNTLDIGAVPWAKANTHLPVIVDPSQGTGKRDLVSPMSLAAIAAGADGLIIEVHPNPDHAIKDGSQSITIPQYQALVPKVASIAQAIGRTVANGGTG